MSKTENNSSQSYMEGDPQLVDSEVYALGPDAESKDMQNKMDSSFDDPQKRKLFKRQQTSNSYISMEQNDQYQFYKEKYKQFDSVFIKAPPQQIRSKLNSPNILWLDEIHSDYKSLSRFFNIQCSISYQNAIAKGRLSFPNILIVSNKANQSVIQKLKKEVPTIRLVIVYCLRQIVIDDTIPQFVECHENPSKIQGPHQLQLPYICHVSEIDKLKTILNEKREMQPTPNFVKASRENQSYFKKRHSIFTNRNIGHQKIAFDDFVTLLKVLFPPENLQDFLSTNKDQIKNILKEYSKESQFYKVINMAQRKLNKLIETAWFRYPLFKLQSEISAKYKQSKIYDQQVYRGCLFNQYQLIQLKQGQFISEVGFFSTSRNKECVYQKGFIKNCLVTIELNVGEGRQSSGFCQLIKQSNHPSQQEILFNPMNLFKILQIKKEYDQKLEKQIWYLNLQFLDKSPTTQLKWIDKYRMIDGLTYGQALIKQNCKPQYELQFKQRLILAKQRSEKRKVNYEYGYFFMVMGQQQKAIQKFKIASQYGNHSHFYALIPRCYTNIGQIYNSQAWLKSNNILQSCLNHPGQFYSSSPFVTMAMNYIQRKRIPEAYLHIIIAYKICVPTFKLYYSKILFTHASLCKQMKDYIGAIRYAELSLSEYSQIIGISYIQSPLLQLLLQLYIIVKDYQKGMKIIEKFYETVFEKVGEDPRQIIMLNLHMASLCINTGRYSKFDKICQQTLSNIRSLKKINIHVYKSIALILKAKLNMACDNYQTAIQNLNQARKNYPQLSQSQRRYINIDNLKVMLSKAFQHSIIIPQGLNSSLQKKYLETLQQQQSPLCRLLEEKDFQNLKDIIKKDVFADVDHQIKELQKKHYFLQTITERELLLFAFFQSNELDEIDQIAIKRLQMLGVNKECAAFQYLICKKNQKQAAFSILQYLHGPDIKKWEI